ncbi:MAG TPA: hypothetical protein VEC11_16655 [Allosphingosinicella sp.]|nr:hypothetical protein [Allosphingosinicella sp.]
MRSMGIAALTALGAGATLLATAASAQPGSRPVRIGLGGSDFDACQVYAEVSGLNPRGDNFLSVRAWPGTGTRELDRLGPRQRVWMCEIEIVPGWTGIVYGPRGSTGCGVESPVPRPRAYRGPCRSGWVSNRFIRAIAG